MSKTTTPRYISQKDIAVMIRNVIKSKFEKSEWSGGKPSVTIDKYAGGGAINIRYTDGPAKIRVSEFIAPFEAAKFDSMIDMRYSVREHWLLPDGTVTIAYCEGTQNSAGAYPEKINQAPDPKAELVTLSSCFVFVERSYSPEFKKYAIEALNVIYGDGAFFINDYGGWEAQEHGMDHHLNKFIVRADGSNIHLAAESARSAIKEARRIASLNEKKWCSVWMGLDGCFYAAEERRNPKDESFTSCSGFTVEALKEKRRLRYDHATKSLLEI